MNRKQKRTTPVASAIWPSLNEPDYRFNDNGVYSTKLLFEPNTNEEHAAFISMLEALYEEAVEEELSQLTKAKRNAAKKSGKDRADSPIRQVLDDNGDPTGEITVNFKMNASGTSKTSGERWTRKPTIFDSSGVKTTATIGGGSDLRISFTANPFYMGSQGAGLSLRLEAVQLITRVAPGGTADDFGFDEVDGGFTSEGDEQSDAVTTSASDDDF